MPKCKNCGDQFTPSRSGATVNCPTCRTPEGRRSKKQTAPTPSSNTCTVCRGDRVVESRSAVTGTVSKYPCYGCGGTGRKM